MYFSIGVTRPYCLSSSLVCFAVHVSHDSCLAISCIQHVQTCWIYHLSNTYHLSLSQLLQYHNCTHKYTHVSSSYTCTSRVCWFCFGFLCIFVFFLTQGMCVYFLVVFWFSVYFLSFVFLSLVFGTNASDCLETLVPKMMCRVWCKTLLAHSLCLFSPVFYYISPSVCPVCCYLTICFPGTSCDTAGNKCQFQSELSTCSVNFTKKCTPAWCVQKCWLVQIHKTPVMPFDTNI